MFLNLYIMLEGDKTSLLQIYEDIKKKWLQ